MDVGHEHHQLRPHLDLHAHGRRHRVHDVLDIVVLVIIGLGSWFLWPVSLGGNTQFIVVEGQSMEPRYHVGDVVVVKAHDHPQVGDIIVFRVPDGEPGDGMLVVHRVHAIRPDGSYETKGDNRDMPDNWGVRSDDILGEPRVTLPKFGRLIGIFSSPLIVGGAAGVLTVLFLWPKRKDDSTSGEEAGAVDVDAAGGEPLGLEADAGEEPVPVT